MTYADYKAVYIDKTVTLKDWQENHIAGRINPKSAMPDKSGQIARQIGEIPQEAPPQGSVTSSPTGGKRWAYRDKFLTVDEIVKATNPRFLDSEAYQLNCQRCVPACEMGIRGRAVIASGAPAYGDGEFAEYYWDKVFEGAVAESILDGVGKETIIARMREWGDGARAEVYVKWENNDKFGHVFLAENRTGEIHFLDPQTGELDVEHYFDVAESGFTKFFRIDNLEPNEILIAECCEEVPK